MDQATPNAHPYQQVAGDLAAKITGGALAPGERLPSVRALAEEYGTTNATIQRTLALLAEQGLVDRVPNVGLFVRDPQSPTARTATVEDVMRALTEVQEALADLGQRVARLEEVADVPTGQPAHRSG
ncbi:GntR family transcriptional regulator [Actinosynnema mirum]|uniref:Transcriptional regulator, GntR family n=1 Tax=Actinosynnema mirum (strain ATCC 29888 / DSM 43827 / JCM 3225 / NBRC 14064 / NCIMB 13271 / NRRL B-12336 / IMRU 3971 / 101) TaxID=446462 RepID=C6WQ08_ACTMD|nr:winged helix-turn-helix domain-containing protein [Actinosynnema mirum]ACU35064.1 transcriptional regulator, GntR family [Actinosynnema mirum DSM 43827]